jgi:hypothetical protein
MQAACSGSGSPQTTGTTRSTAATAQLTPGIKAEITLNPYTPEQWPEGIFETGQAPLSRQLRIVNQWQSDAFGTHLQVYAGYLETDATQGIVVIHNTPFSLQGGEGHTYYTPTKVGAVRIVAVNGERLELISKSGSVFTFDVAAREFIGPDPLPVWPSGIFALGEAAFPAGQPFPGNVYQISNVWQGQLDGQHVRVFAGSYLSVPAQGTVVMQRVPADLWPKRDVGTPRATLFTTETDAGSLRITSAAGDTLSLLSSEGMAFTFDVKLGQLLAQ